MCQINSKISKNCKREQQDVKEDEEKKKKTRDGWTYDQSKCIVNLWYEKQDILYSSRCNQAWSSIKIEVGKYGNSKSVLQCKNKIKALKDQYQKAKENNGKSGEESKSLPLYDRFDRILSERTFLTMPEFKEVGQKSVSASPKFSKSHQNNTEKSQANNTNDSKFFVFTKGTLPMSDILELLKGHPLFTDFRV